MDSILTIIILIAILFLFYKTMNWLEGLGRKAFDRISKTSAEDGAMLKEKKPSKLISFSIFLSVFLIGIIMVEIFDPLIEKKPKQTIYLALLTVSLLLAYINVKRGVMIAVLFASFWGFNIATNKEVWENRKLVSAAPAPVISSSALKAKESKKAKTQEMVWIEVTKDGVRSHLKDPRSAQFRNVQLHKWKNIPVVCGEVNSKNSFGAYLGYQRFVASGNSVLLLEEQAADFENVWFEACK